MVLKLMSILRENVNRLTWTIRKIKKDIISVIKETLVIKQQIARNTQQAFEHLKEALIELTKEYNLELTDKNEPKLFFEFLDKSPFECELRIAGDLLIFNMHSNVF